MVKYSPKILASNGGKKNPPTQSQWSGLPKHSALAIGAILLYIWDEKTQSYILTTIQAPRKYHQSSIATYKTAQLVWNHEKVSCLLTDNMFRPPYNETKRGLRNQQPDTKALELERIMFRAAGCVENLQRPLNPNTIQMQKDFVVHINHEMEIRLPAHSHRQQSTHTTRTRTHARTHIHTHTHEKTIKIAFSVSFTSEYTIKTTSPFI